MPEDESTPEDLKTLYGKVADFHKARNELDEDSYGELVRDVANYEDDLYDSAQELARAFHEDDPAKYNRNQMDIRATAKEEVDKKGQPQWAWDLLSFYSDDLGRTVLEIPSGGNHKGLLVTTPNNEGNRKCYLYSKDANGIDATKHIERFHLNIKNAESIGERFPSETAERVALELPKDEGGTERVPAIEMDYNEEMVPTDELKEYLPGKVKFPGKWLNSLKHLWEHKLESSYSEEDVESWYIEEQDRDIFFKGGEELFDLGDLIRQGLFFNGGPGEYKPYNGNFAFIFPERWWEREEYSNPEDVEEAAEKLFEESEIMMVDSGEYAQEAAISEEGIFDRMIEEDPLLTEEEKQTLED